MTEFSRFVVLRHETPAAFARPPHWDLMLEAGDVLRTWALPTEPQIGRAVIAEQLADHRLAYLDYEGPISGGRGEVRRWDRGVWELVDESEGELIALVRGEKLSGRLTLTREPTTAQRWRFFFLAEPTTRGSATEPGPA